MKIKIFLILLFVLFFNKIGILFAQNVTADFLINKLKYDKIYLYTDEDIIDENLIMTFGRDTYFDLTNKIWIHPSLKNKDQQLLAEESEFKAQIVKGSFIIPHNKEYILILHTGYIGGHVELGGRTTFIIIFNDKFEQIAEIGRQYADTKYVEKIDIDKDGIEEVFFSNGSAWQGCCKDWIMIFSGEFNKPLLTFEHLISCENAGIEDMKFITLNSKYKFKGSSLIFESKLDYYISKGYDNKNERFVNKLLKTEYKKDVYKYKNKSFEHVISKDNVNWDEEGLEF